MYFIDSQPNESGNHGNPQSTRFSNSVALPDSLIPDYINCRGFALLTVKHNTVISLEVNQAALDTYLAAHPDEPSPAPSELRKLAYTTGIVDNTDWHIERDGAFYTCDELTQLGVQYEFRGETDTANSIKALVSAKIAEIRATYPDAIN